MENKKGYILISGATSGIGLETAKLFAAHGWNLILAGRRIDRLNQLKPDILSTNPMINIHTLNFDIQQEKEVEKSVLSVPENILKRIEVLVNNAGLALGRTSIEKGNTSDWGQMIDTNIKGLLYLSKQIIPYLKNNKRGHIVNISSIAGKEVYVEGNVYCATKHAVDALSKSMRMDLLPYNIKVTNIAPGAVETEFSLVRFKGDEQISKAVYNGYQPLSPLDIADTIYFACSRPAHVTLNDITIMPTAQASSTLFNKNN